MVDGHKAERVTATRMEQLAKAAGLILQTACSGFDAINSRRRQTREASLYFAVEGWQSLTTSPAQPLNDSALPLNSWPPKDLASNFGLGLDATLFPSCEAKSAKHAAAPPWNLVLNDIKRVVLCNRWLHHNPVPPLLLIRVRP